MASKTTTVSSPTPGIGLEAVVVFDAKERVPLTGELFYDGTRIVEVTVKDFQSRGG